MATQFLLFYKLWNSSLIWSTVVTVYSKDFGVVVVATQLKVQKFLSYFIAGKRPFFDTINRFLLENKVWIDITFKNILWCFNLLCKSASYVINMIFDCYGAMSVSSIEKIWSGRPFESSFSFLTHINWWLCWVTTWKLMFEILRS